MEFLKEILGEELFKQFETAVNAYNGNEANKDRQLKLANLASGEYVGKGKYDALQALLDGKTTELDTANGLISELKKGTKGNEELQGKITGYETQVADLQKQLAETKLKSAIKVALGDWEVDKKIATVTITCDCEPWKYKADITQRLFSITTSGTATLNNLRKPVVPKITTNAAITLSWSGESVSLSAGTDIIVPELILREGNTSITITGTANVTFKYQEGGF